MVEPVTYYSTNNKAERVNFETALLNGMASKYGLYMMDRASVPKLSPEQIKEMESMSYAQIAFQVLNPFLKHEISQKKLEGMLDDAYSEDKIPTVVQHVTGKSHVMWLTQGPTYSFKDYAARFFGRTLNHFLGERGLKRTVIVATSGDTGGAVADALYGLDNVKNIVFFPHGEISERQKRQMTTLKEDVYAFEVNGNFDICQDLAKTLLGDEAFAESVSGDRKNFTSANSISIGRLLPQAVYPFFAYSRVAKNGEKMIASVPSGNFGDMAGTMLAKEMGLPVGKILVGLNPNKAFLEFIKTGEYHVSEAIETPSSAMKVSHPSNLARVVDFYGGHMFDLRDSVTNKVLRYGAIDVMPDLGAMRKDFFVHSISNEEHYQTMKDAFDKHGIIFEPHGAVGWRTLEVFNQGNHNNHLAVVYETAGPGKFPLDVEKAIGITPPVPEGMRRQEKMEERIYHIESPSTQTKEGLRLSDSQVGEAKSKIRDLFSS
ncbi:MAG: threonine synthase [archaeon]